MCDVYSVIASTLHIRQIEWKSCLMGKIVGLQLPPCFFGSSLLENQRWHFFFYFAASFLRFGMELYSLLHLSHTYSDRGIDQSVRITRGLSSDQ